MVGVYSGERSPTASSPALAVAAAGRRAAPGAVHAGDGVSFRRRLHRRRLRPLHEGAGARRLRAGARHVDRLRPRAERLDKFEYPVLVLLATLGMMMMVSANDLIALYVGLELQSLALYVVAAINRDNRARPKPASSTSSSARCRRACCSTARRWSTASPARPASPEIAAAIGGDASIGLIFGLVFLLAGLAFKISAVPFHMWTPDVYEGAPTPVTAFFAAAPKVAAMALFIRVVIDTFEPHHPRLAADRHLPLASPRWCSAPSPPSASSNIKRLMAYSSIGHVGFALVGLAAGTAGRRRGRRHLHGDLHHHDARHLRLHPRHAPRGRHRRGDRRSRRPRAAPTDRWPHPRHADVLADRHAAARRLLRQVVRLPRRHRGRASSCSR